MSSYKSTKICNQTSLEGAVLELLMSVYQWTLMGVIQELIVIDIYVAIMISQNINVVSSL